MPVPKQKQGRIRTHTRRSSCGFYKDREVIVTE